MNIKKHIPNALTLLNLLSGCVAIVFALTGSLNLVPYCVAVSLFADFLDGLVARALGVSSPIGKELDSLADMVSFGVLPSIILLVLIFLNPTSSDMYQNELLDITSIDFVKSICILITFSIALFSALRLAKFNIDETQSEEFKGLATPASCIFVIGILLAYQYQNLELNYITLSLISIVLSLLLISNIPMFSFKLKGFSWEKAKWQYVFLILAAISLISFKFAGISITIAIYVVLNIIRYLLNRKHVQS